MHYLIPWEKRLKPEHRYIHTVILPRHEGQIGTRDPRRVWIYDAGIQNSSVQEHGVNRRLYRFANEEDLTLFILRWGSGE